MLFGRETERLLNEVIVKIVKGWGICGARGRIGVSFPDKRGKAPDKQGKSPGIDSRLLA